MTETTQPDYIDMAREEVASLEDKRVRLGEVLETISRVAADKLWSMRYEVDDGLVWDHERQVWAAEDGFAYDGATAVGSTPARTRGGG